MCIVRFDFARKLNQIKSWVIERSFRARMEAPALAPPPRATAEAILVMGGEWAESREEGGASGRRGGGLLANTSPGHEGVSI